CCRRELLVRQRALHQEGETQGLAPRIVPHRGDFGVADGVADEQLNGASRGLVAPALVHPIMPPSLGKRCSPHKLPPERRCADSSGRVSAQCALCSYDVCAGRKVRLRQRAYSTARVSRTTTTRICP